MTKTRGVLSPVRGEVVAQERRVRFQAALAECARALLASTGEHRLEHALEALLTATEATYVCVERNVQDVDLGFCSQTVAEVETSNSPDFGLHDHYWDVVPWERMPISRSHLERGEPFVVIPDQLDGPEYELYAADPYPVRSELDIPINVNGDWAGLIGFADVQTAREWSDEDLSLLTTAASMIGAFWERETSREQVAQSARYETALAECAQALLASSGEDRIDHALKALLVASEATCVFLECNVIDAELGFCSQFVAGAENPRTTSHAQEDEFWEIVPWNRMPTSRQMLEDGQPVVIIPEQLEGPEYDQYAADPFPVESELEVPIFVDGRWAGLIGFSDQAVRRHWTDTEVSLLATAAKMFGAFWEREADRERLEQMNRAKDAFLASVSHELRTPLTAVVGFGQVLQESTHTMSEEDRADLLKMLVAEGTDLTNIVNDLLVAARADIGALEVTMVPVNLRAQTAQVMESFEWDQTAHIELVAPTVRATGDPDRVRQVIRNLVSNALRYGGDAIRIEVLDGGTHAKVLVCDDGSGIPEKDRERIFEPYQRAHDAPGLPDSLGLGLAISRQLSQLMGGDLTYRHQDGESIFELTLPPSA